MINYKTMQKSNIMPTLTFCDFFRSQNPVRMHTFSICTLNTLQNITKTLAQNYREGQTGVK
jgi:hypothetical protein